MSEQRITTNSYELYLEGDRLYQTMLSDILNAQQSIYLETYIFYYDAIGKQFIEALNQAANRGVQVSVTLDAAGSRQWLTQNLIAKKFNSLVRLHWFHRWSWRNPLRFNVRNHKKLLVIDSTLAYVGGFNIHQEPSKKFSGERRWLDFHVKATGPVADSLNELARLFWNRKIKQIRPSKTDKTIVLPTVNRYCRKLSRKVILSLIRGSEQSITLITPYFVPDNFIVKALIGAVKRGVNVELIIPKRSDSDFIDWVARGYFTKLLKEGVIINEYVSRMLHAKALMIDRQELIIGSSNMDYRSLFINYELVLLSKNKPLVQSLSHAIDTIRKDCHTYSFQQWKYQAWKYLPIIPLGALLKRYL